MKSCCAISLATCSDTLHCRNSTELHGCRPDVCILPYCISSGITQFQICNAGDFSEMMRRQGATGDDWSDWDAHLPGSPGSAGLPEAMSSISLSRSLSKQTSDKFEAGEGEPCIFATQGERLTAQNPSVSDLSLQREIILIHVAMQSQELILKI